MKKIFLFILIAFASLGILKAKDSKEVKFSIYNQDNVKVEFTVGINEKATYLIDQAIGEEDLPTVGFPGGLFAGILQLTDTLNKEYRWTYHDYRPITDKDKFEYLHYVRIYRPEGDQLFFKLESPIPAGIDSVIIYDEYLDGQLVRYDLKKTPQFEVQNQALKNFLVKVSYNLSNSSVEDLACDVLKIYPNPVSDKINVSGAWENIEIYNQYGIKVLNANNDGQNIDLKELPTGLYLIKNESGKSAAFIKN